MIKIVFAVVGLGVGIVFGGDRLAGECGNPLGLPAVSQWHGVNLLGLFNANTKEPDPRVRGCFEEKYFRWLRGWGFNFARLPMDYRHFVSTNDWTQFRAEGLAKVDQAVAWGRKYNVHVQLCLHRAPGYTVLSWDPDRGNLRTDKEPQDAFIRIWTEFARRYRGIGNDCLSFNLVNEPTGFSEEQFIDVFGRTIEAIRRQDPDRFVMLDGNDCASVPVPHFYRVPLTGQAFRGYTPHAISHYKAWYIKEQPETEPSWPLSEEMARRKEWIYERPETTLAKFAAPRAAGYPVMIGEFGCYNKLSHETCLAWMESCLKLWQEAGLGWAIWNVDGPFGFMDSNRADVRYEDFEGHKLDRRMLDLLRKYATREGMSGLTFRDDADYLRRKFREDVTDRSTGLGLPELKREARQVAEELRGREPWCIVKARMFERICDRMSIGVSAHDFFPAFACYSRRDRVLTDIMNERIAEIDRTVLGEVLSRRGNRAKDVLIRHDYDHATPDWDAALALGFSGLRDRNLASPSTNAQHRAMAIAAEAMVRTVSRLARHARAEADRTGDARIGLQADALERLAKGPPRTAHEAMMFQLLFFVFGEHVDHLQVRTLGNWDRLMEPYYRADVAAGRETRESFKEKVRHFWWQWGSIDNWWGQPVYIGGTKADGSTEYNEVSRIVLEVQDELALPTPKLQMKIAANTPAEIFEKGLDLARRQRSVVFCGEAPMARASKAMGFTEEDARTLELWGCYEFQPRARANTTLPCVVNMVAIVADLLADAKAGRLDAATFEDFQADYLSELDKRTDEALEIVREIERPMDEFVPALVHSLTIGRCVEEGKNAIGDGMEHNLTVILQTGSGTAADALAAVREIVYEKKLMPLAELGEVMAGNWKGQEELRLRMLASPRKWGNHDPLTDEICRKILGTFGDHVNGLPNGRNGRFFAAGHSIDFFYLMARGTGATPDGRRAGDEFGKNLSPTPGADREGATALIASFGELDVSKIPADIIYDVMLHPSTAMGPRGIMLMRTLVETYFSFGGTAIHFNVLDPKVLRDAQVHPERYENLLVRVCGWNVRFNDLGRREQDAYILRAENVMQ